MHTHTLKIQALGGAIKSGHVEVVKVLIRNLHLDTWNSILAWACEMETRATKKIWNGDPQLLWEGIQSDDHVAIVKLIAARAYWCNNCDSSATDHL
jgi:hypothetical protein